MAAEPDSILLAFILGAVSGAAVALLYAPASGRETREFLGEKARGSARAGRRRGGEGPRRPHAGPRDADHRHRARTRGLPAGAPGDRVNGLERRLSRHHRRGHAGHRDRADCGPRRRRPRRPARGGARRAVRARPQAAVRAPQRHRPRRLARRGAGHRAGGARRPAVHRRRAPLREDPEHRPGHGDRPRPRRARPDQRVQGRHPGRPRASPDGRARQGRSEDEDALFI